MFFEELWKEFAELPEVEAITLGGSRAGENYDEKSDYDLYLYCSRIPEEGLREEILSRYCRYREIGNHFWEPEDDCTLKDGVDIDILYRNLKDFEQEVASVVERHLPHNGYTTCMWHNLLHSRVLYDRNGELTAMQKRFAVPYPEELRTNIIEQNMRLLTGNLPSYDGQIAKAWKRGDLVSVNHRTAAFLESYFDILFAANRLTHPGEKRMVQYAKEHASGLPKDFTKDFETLFANLFSDGETTADTIRRMTEHLREYVGGSGGEKTHK